MGTLIMIKQYLRFAIRKRTIQLLFGILTPVLGVLYIMNLKSIVVDGTPLVLAGMPAIVLFGFSAGMWWGISRDFRKTL